MESELPQSKEQTDEDTFQRGVNAFQERRYATAYEDFASLKGWATRQCEVQAYLGYAVFALKGRRTGLSAEAGLRILLRAVQENEQRARPAMAPFLLIARACEERGYPKQAIEHLRRAVALDPTCREVRQQLHKLGGEPIKPQRRRASLPLPKPISSKRKDTRRTTPLLSTGVQWVIGVGLVAAVGGLVATYDTQTPPVRPDISGKVQHIVPLSSFSRVHMGWQGTLDPSWVASAAPSEIAARCRALLDALGADSDESITLRYTGEGSPLTCSPEVGS